MKTYNYKAYIASNQYSKAFDFAYGTTKSAAIAAVKRQNSPSWKDCYVWVECINDKNY